jgi:hypothetical protein
MSRRLLVAALSAAVILVPAGASAQVTSPLEISSAGSGAEASAKLRPRPANATVKITHIGHLRNGRAMIMSDVPVIGTLAPFRARQRVKVTYFLNGRKLRTKSVRARKGKGNFGVFRSRIRLRRGGKYAVSARHVANRALGADRTIRKSWKVRYKGLSFGDCGRLATGFRKALRRIGYIGHGDCYRGKTARGVLAYRKANGMSRNFHAGKGLVKQVFLGKGRYRVRHPGYGEHVEVSLSRQILVFANGKRPVAVYPISSGAPATPTVQGHFEFYSSQPGYNSVGMYYSRYFYGGYAIHGYHSVPNYPASHGCVRTFISDQPEIYQRIFIGEDIFVY